MANKRYLKKNIETLCAAMANDAMLAAQLDSRVDSEKIAEILRRIASLQATSLSRATFFFDKAERDFEDRAAYRRARSKYYREAFEKLRSEFNHEGLSIIKDLNAAVPEDVRKSVASVK